MQIFQSSNGFMAQHSCSEKLSMYDKNDIDLRKDPGGNLATISGQENSAIATSKYLLVVPFPF